MAGNYNNNNGSYRGETAAAGDEHGYEWEQAREQERLEREANSGTGQAPPAYDPTSKSPSIPLNHESALEGPSADGP